ncbi:MAG: LysR family transcriptional regulator [Burkholderiaceae bacterium]|jgi:DNA-binding transcriptional LysR family regulator|nr:LysR family transcriptional regulator [Burkholderiaceae bacterium]
MISVSLRQWQVFVQTGALGSLRAAAASLHVTQPAASMALAEMERLLGAPLFDRERNRLRLNTLGRRLLPSAQDLLARHEELERIANGSAMTLVGELRIGASNTVGNYLNSELLGGFIRAHPHITLQLRVGNTGDIAHAVADHQLDAGCVEGPALLPQLQTLPWRDDRLAVCATPAHPLTALAAKRPLRARDFHGQRWILREPHSATRALSEQALMKLPDPANVLELSQTEAIKQAVKAGLGIAFLPEAAIGDELAAKRLAVLPTPFLDLRRQITVLLRRGRYRGAVLDAFLDSLSLQPDTPAKAGMNRPGQHESTRIK